MNIETKAITAKFEAIKEFFILHAKIIAFVTLVTIIGFMVLRIYLLAGAEPTEDQVDEKISSLKISKLDQESVKIIESLEDRNISIESLFPEGRTNPFQD